MNTPIANIPRARSILTDWPGLFADPRQRLTNSETFVVFGPWEARITVAYEDDPNEPDPPGTCTEAK